MRTIVVSAFVLSLLFCVIFEVFGAELEECFVPDKREQGILPHHPFPQKLCLPPRPIDIRTPMGIRVRMSTEAILQYEGYWQVDVEDIDWEVIDAIAQGWMDKIHRYVNPKNIAVTILPWDKRCRDEDTYAPREMRGCLDGMLAGGTAMIHLGDESANKNQAYFRIQSNGDGSVVDNEATRFLPTNPFCGTSLGHELYHLISGVDLNWNFPQNPPGICD